MSESNNPDSTRRDNFDIYRDALEEDFKQIEASIPKRPPVSVNDSENVSKELNEKESTFLKVEMADEAPYDVLHSFCDPSLPDMRILWDGKIEKSRN